jgi:hypothetical protein
MAGSNAERAARVAKAIEDKVNVLEEIADKSRPCVDGLPTSMNEFRKWVDPELGLVKIGSSTSTSRTESPQHEPLLNRADEAMRRIKSMLKQRKLRVYVSVSEKVRKLDRQNSELEEENRRLASEGLMFKHKFDESIKALRKADLERDVALSQLNNFRVEFNKAMNNKPRRVK